MEGNGEEDDGSVVVVDPKKLLGWQTLHALAYSSNDINKVKGEIQSRPEQLEVEIQGDTPLTLAWSNHQPNQESIADLIFQSTLTWHSKRNQWAFMCVANSFFVTEGRDPVFDFTFEFDGYPEEVFALGVYGYLRYGREMEPLALHLIQYIR